MKIEIGFCQCMAIKVIQMVTRYIIYIKKPDLWLLGINTLFTLKKPDRRSCNGSKFLPLYWSWYTATKNMSILTERVLSLG